VLLHTLVRLKVKGAHRGEEKTKVEAFGNWKFFQVSGRKVHKLRREQQTAVGSAGIRSGPLVFMSKEQPEERKEGEQIWASDLGEKSRQPSDLAKKQGGYDWVSQVQAQEIVDRRMFTQNPVSRWIGRR
jgi:hypothetical protein